MSSITLDFFRNTTAKAICFVDTVLESSCTDVYTAVLHSVSPRKSRCAARFERSLLWKNKCSEFKLGFTLIELLIVLLIMSILLAYPLMNVQKQINRTHRLDGQMALLDLANRMERYYTKYHTYQHASIGNNRSSDVLNTPHSPEGWYILSILQATNKSYLLQARLATEHAKTDKACSILTLSSNGEMNFLKPDHCW